MTPPRSAFVRRAAAFSAVLLAALAVALPVIAASAAVQPSAISTATVAPPAVPTLSVSLLASAPTIPAGGTFGYTADIRLGKRASYLQAILEVSRPSGSLLFKRTRVANNVAPGSRLFSFERTLTDALSLDPGSYPVKLSVAADIAGSVVTTETTATLRVYSADGPHVRVAIVARVTGQPMMAPDGRFAVDPAQDTGARDAVGALCRRVLTDQYARVALAIPPVLLAEWRRLSGGYTLSDGRTIRPTDPVAVSYNSTLADLKAAIDSGRLELMSLGYADPNLTDLANHGLASDIGPQYDAGISAVFASLEVTPSGGTAPAGGCLPPNEVDLLSQKDVRYIVLDTDCVRVGKDGAPQGVYPVSQDDLVAIAVDESQTAVLSSGDPNPALDSAFARLMHAPKQPLVFEIDITGDTLPSAGSIGVALNAFETQPWLEIVSAADLKPTDSADHVKLVAGKSTKHAPAGFWKTVATARGYAGAYLAALGPSNPEASTAEMQSLLGEASAWAGDDMQWAGATRGTEYADASLKTTKPVLGAITVNVQPITLSGSSGNVPVTIVNGSAKTLNVIVNVVSSGGLRVSGPKSTPIVLGPQETYIEVPVAMQTAFSGKLAVEVSAAGLVLAHKTVAVHSSALDRVALGGMVVLILIGLLVIIVRRVRAAESRDTPAKRGARYTEGKKEDGDHVGPSDR